MNFDRLNRETWTANNVGNNHHPTAGLTPLTSTRNFSTLNDETYRSHNYGNHNHPTWGISVDSILYGEKGSIYR
jgi:hypothetical protein